MYYEEKMFNGILFWRGTPDGLWIAFTLAELSKRAADLQSRISSLEAALSLDDENVERYRKELEIYAGDIRHVITGIRRRVGLEMKEE